MSALRGLSVPFSLADSSRAGQQTGTDRVLFSETGSGLESGDSGRVPFPHTRTLSS